MGVELIDGKAFLALDILPAMIVLMINLSTT